MYICRAKITFIQFVYMYFENIFRQNSRKKARYITLQKGKQLISHMAYTYSQESTSMRMLIGDVQNATLMHVL